MKFLGGPPRTTTRRATPKQSRSGQRPSRGGIRCGPQFLALAHWKSARPAKHHVKSDDATVEEVTRFAFTTPVEPLRLSVLTLLKGVHIRTASAILHLCHCDPYPLMNVRALWSMGCDEEPKDWVAVWTEYTAECR